jgi:hypothetical protein
MHCKDVTKHTVAAHLNSNCMLKDNRCTLPPIHLDAGARLQLDPEQRSVMVSSGCWAHAKRSGRSSGELRLMLWLAEADYPTWAVMLQRAAEE